MKTDPGSENGYIVTLLPNIRNSTDALKMPDAFAERIVASRQGKRAAI